VYENSSKSHIRSYEVIIFKEFKALYPAKISKHASKTCTKGRPFTVFESFSSTSCCSQKFPPIKIKKIGLVGRVRYVVSGMFTLGGQWWMEWRAKVIVQNDGRAQVKPKNKPGRAVLAP